MKDFKEKKKEKRKKGGENTDVKGKDRLFIIRRENSHLFMDKINLKFSLLIPFIHLFYCDNEKS